MQSALILDNVYQKLQFVKCSFHNNYDDYVLCTACFRNSLRNTIRVCFLLKKMGWFLFFFLEFDLCIVYAHEDLIECKAGAIQG